MFHPGTVHVRGCRMKTALLIALMMIAPLQTNWDLYEATCVERFIEEEELVKVKLSCYLPTGNCTADGTEPYEGIISCNREHLGQDCIVYNKDFLPVARFQCRDIGGNKLLREGKAIDVFRTDMSRAKAYIKEMGAYVYIKWIPRDYEGEAPMPDHLEGMEIETE